MTTPDLTPAQIAVLEAIARGAVTVREIAAASGRNVSTVHGVLHRLRRKQLVTWQAGKARTITLVVRGEAT